MPPSNLGELEQLVLLAVARLGDDAYGVTVRREIATRTRRDLSFGSVYATLNRLEAKQLVASHLGDPTPERGGKAKRYFRVTREGLRQVHDTRRVLKKMWRTLPELKGEGT